MNLRLLQLDTEIEKLREKMLPDDRESSEDVALEYATSALSDATNGYQLFEDPDKVKLVLNDLVSIESLATWRTDGADGLAAYLHLSKFALAYNSNPVFQSVMQTMIEDQAY